MALSLKPSHLKRYKDIARLFIKYGHSDLLPSTELDKLAALDEQTTTAPAESKAEALAADLEAMGPLFIKLGQLLSSRPDLLPAPYVVALSRPSPLPRSRRRLSRNWVCVFPRPFRNLKPSPLLSPRWARCIVPPYAVAERLP